MREKQKSFYEENIFLLLQKYFPSFEPCLTTTSLKKKLSCLQSEVFSYYTNKLSFLNGYKCIPAARYGDKLGYILTNRVIRAD